MSCSIKLLVKDSKCLYACWQKLDETRDMFVERMGLDIWNTSKLSIKITNITKNYSFTIIVNDAADNWYINIEDSDCLYAAEIGRSITQDIFFSICSSNLVLVPADKASDNTTACFVNFHDIKGKQISIVSGNSYPIPITALPRYALDKLQQLPGSGEMYWLGVPDWYGISSGEFFNCQEYFSAERKDERKR